MASGRLYLDRAAAGIVMAWAGALAMLPGAVRGAAPLEAASGVSVGVGEAQAPALPRNVAEAEAVHAETVRKCQLLGVEAVRKECIRQAQRTLERDLARLKQGQR